MWKDIIKTDGIFSVRGLTTEETDDIQDYVDHRLDAIVRDVAERFFPHFNAGKTSEFKMNINRAKELNNRKNFIGVHKRLLLHLKKMFDMEIFELDDLIDFLEESVPAVKRAYRFQSRTQQKK